MENITDSSVGKDRAEWSVDEILADPSGYQAAPNTMVEYSAAEWVAREVQRLMDERERARPALGRWIMERFGPRFD
jgi:hypothetical protein